METSFAEKKAHALEICNKQMAHYTEEKWNQGLLRERKPNGKSWTNRQYVDEIINETEDGIEFVDTLWNFKLYLDERGKEY
jgi:hypothetical protein